MLWDTLILNSVSYFLRVSFLVKTFLNVQFEGLDSRAGSLVYVLPFIGQVDIETNWNLDLEVFGRHVSVIIFIFKHKLKLFDLQILVRSVRKIKTVK